VLAYRLAKPNAALSQPVVANPPPACPPTNVFVVAPKACRKLVAPMLSTPAVAPVVAGSTRLPPLIV